MSCFISYILLYFSSCIKNEVKINFAFSVHSRFARAHNNPFSYPLRFLESRLLAGLGVSCCHATGRGAKYCARHFGTSFMKLSTRRIVRHIHSCFGRSLYRAVHSGGAKGAVAPARKTKCFFSNIVSDFAGLFLVAILVRNLTKTEFAPADKKS